MAEDCSHLMKEANIRMVLGKHRSIVSVSAGIEELLGFSPQDFLSESTLLEARIHKDDDDVAALLFSDNIEPIHGSVNFRLRHADGRIICVKGEFKKSASDRADASQLELRLSARIALDRCEVPSPHDGCHVEYGQLPGHDGLHR
ncbi:MAG: hypothetical protein RLZZ371_1937 [Pseudomonadota bacterium]